MKKTSQRLATVLALLTVSTLALTGCSSTDNESDKGPIVIGSSNTISGAATFPEASQAAAAVFNKVNESGGIDGRKIKYDVLDDKGDPATSTANARQLVGQDNAVALVGSASLLDCQLNASYYEQQNILSMPGVGVDTGCFDSKNISPVNVGPFNDMTLTLLYGSQELHLDNICVLLEIAGSTKPAYLKAIDRWTEITGKKPLYVDATVPYGASDYTPYIVKARNAGCKALAVNPVEPDAIAQVKAANAQGWNDVTWLYLTSVYSQNFAKAVSDAGKGIYVPAEFYPFTEATSPINKDWYDLISKNNITPSSFSQGGYLAATYFVDVLKSIKGPITRSSVTDALRNMKPIDNPMAGQPYRFGVQRSEGWPVVLHSGTNAWAKDADSWFRLPNK